MNKFVNFSYQTLLFFAVLGVLFIPFSFQSWGFQSEVTKFIFEDLILFLSSFFERIYISTPEISSDSTTFYLLFFILIVIAIILSVTFPYFHFFKNHRIKIINLIQLVLTYYLIIIMLKYGFDKLFKAQFYLPEPNTLYTPLGMLDKDLLYWSTMGTSYTYNLFMGLIEIIPALMMLHKRTRVVGLFILLGVLTNVVVVNFSFDISVKLFSLFLLLINLLLLSPYFGKVYHFFVLNKPTTLPQIAGEKLIASKTIRLSLKAIIVFFFFSEAVLSYIKSGQFNDDNVPRNQLHGAYQIIATEQLATQENIEDLKLKRFFIHRHNYFIFQYEDDTMEDFYLEINPSKKQFILTSYDGEIIKLDYAYSKSSGKLQIKSDELGLTIYAKALPWRNLPLLHPFFHWTVDEVD